MFENGDLGIAQDGMPFMEDLAIDTGHMTILERRSVTLGDVRSPFLETRTRSNREMMKFHVKRSS
jgi:hypothetical protein